MSGIGLVLCNGASSKSGIDWLLSQSQKLCVTFALTYVASRMIIVYQRVYSWVGVHLSPLVACRITSHTKDAGTLEWKLSVARLASTSSELL